MANKVANSIKDALLRSLKFPIALQEHYNSNIIDKEDVNCIKQALD